MCGCMLMHAMMDHQEHQPGVQAASRNNAMQMSGQQHCAHCGFPCNRVLHSAPVVV